MPSDQSPISGSRACKYCVNVQQANMAGGGGGGLKKTCADSLPIPCHVILNQY